jgi:hypothetical protein
MTTEEFFVRPPPSGLEKKRNNVKKKIRGGPCPAPQGSKTLGEGTSKNFYKFYTITGKRKSCYR